jgi:molybdopterin/thiamine biosynthesis adenylyltransferase
MSDSERASVPLAVSRLVAAVEALGAAASEGTALFTKPVLVTGAPDALATPNGRVMVLTAIRLLVRMGVRLTVTLEDAPAALVAELRDDVARIGGPPEIVHDRSVDPASFAAVLSVGGPGRSGVPWTTIWSNGWLARVSSVGDTPSYPCDVSNPIAATAAGALGVTEIFKRLVAVSVARGPLARDAKLSLHTYRADDESIGPPLPPEVRIAALLIGFGAIGNAIGHVIRELPVAGRLGVVDRQTFGTENQGTCMLIAPADVGQPKATVAEAMLGSPRLEVRGHTTDAEGLDDLPALWESVGFDGVPTVIMNGLDSIDARRAVQLLWPDLVLDGAIGDFMCQVGRHPSDPASDTACLRCTFPASPAGRPATAEQVAAEASGLSEARARDGQDVVREVDVNSAPEDKRGFLRGMIGRKICSVTSEAVLRAISTEDQPDGFEASTAFVACLSGAFVVAELVKASMGLPSPLEPQWQMDVLVGPGGGMDIPSGRRKGCECVRFGGAITQLRAARLTRMTEDGEGVGGA